MGTVKDDQKDIRYRPSPISVNTIESIFQKSPIIADDDLSHKHNETHHPTKPVNNPVDDRSQKQDTKDNTKHNTQHSLDVLDPAMRLCREPL